MSPLISTQSLAAQLRAPDLRLLDATYYLPAEALDARAEFASARLPDARFFDIDVVADPDQTALPHMAPSAGRFARLVEEMGIDNDSTVVVYDQRGQFAAARAWWLFRLFGHDRVAVLDGGRAKWLAEGRATDAGDPPPAIPATFRPRLRAGLLRGVADLMDNLHQPAELVVDVRSAARFSGTQPEPRAGVRAGHIPGAVNLPYTTLLAPDATLLPPEALRRVLNEAGVDGVRKVMASCGSGVSACILALAAAQAGLPPIAVYDGSWTEWGSRPDTPIEK